MEKSEALRLADELEEAAGEYWRFQKSTGYGAAAELRRLSAENKLLHERHHDDNVEYTRVQAQRDALLEKIKAVIAAEQSEGAGRGGFVNTPPTREHQRRVAQAWQELHAAIKTVEGENK